MTSELYIPTFASKTKVMKKRVSAVVIVLVCLGGVACIKTLSTSSVGLPQLAFDNIEALASGESSAYVVYLLPEQLMKNVIVVLLVAVAVYTYRRKDWGDVSAVKQFGLAALLGSVVMAFGIGFYDGFFGPGTGSFLIFGFLFLGYDFVTAAGNAKALNFASGIGALLSFTLSGSVLWTYGLLMGFAMVIGAYFGSRMAIRHGASYVKPLYLIVTTLLIGKQVYELLFK